MHPIQVLKTLFLGTLNKAGFQGKGIQLFRYILVGLSNIAVDFVIYIGLTRGWEFWAQHYLWANFVSFIVVITWSFFWNKYWTFQERSQHHSAQYLKFLVVTVIGIGIYQIILYTSVQFFLIHDLLAKLIATPLMALWNFFMHRRWTFANPSQKASSDNPESDTVAN